MDPDQGVLVKDEMRCIHCGRCLQVCPVSADPAAKTMTVAELLHQLERAAPFIDGVTASGGEATCQIDFLAAFCAALKSHETLRHLTVLIDTNGTLPPHEWQRLLPFVDGAMVDLKSPCPQQHLDFTGQELQKVEDTIGFLHGQGKLLEVRILIIPGFNDTKADLAATARFLAKVDPGIPVTLIPLHTQAITRECRDRFQAASLEIMISVKNYFTAAGLTQVSYRSLAAADRK
jgi:pyruvate-formate lyase-activating enzyme